MIFYLELCNRSIPHEIATSRNHERDFFDLGSSLSSSSGRVLRLGLCCGTSSLSWFFLARRPRSFFSLVKHNTNSSLDVNGAVCAACASGASGGAAAELEELLEEEEEAEEGTAGAAAGSSDSVDKITDSLTTSSRFLM